MLSGRVQYIKGAKLTGRLLTNGAPRDQAEFANISAYVTQDDNLYGQLVRACVIYICIESIRSAPRPAKSIHACCVHASDRPLDRSM